VVRTRRRRATLPDFRVRPIRGGVVEAAKEAGAARVFWNTHETNAVARRLYDAVAERTGFIQHRIEPLG
jgi:hypothetical protein